MPCYIRSYINRNELCLALILPLSVIATTSIYVLSPSTSRRRLSRLFIYLMYEPIRGGTRGGQAEFKWSDVSADKDREVCKHEVLGLKRAYVVCSII